MEHWLLLYCSKFKGFSLETFLRHGRTSQTSQTMKPEKSWVNLNTNLIFYLVFSIIILIGEMTNYFYLFIVVIDFQFYLKRNSDIIQERQTVMGGAAAGWADRGWCSRVEREERRDVCMVSSEQWAVSCPVRLSVTGWTGAGHYFTQISSTSFIIIQDHLEKTRTEQPVWD